MGKSENRRKPSNFPHFALLFLQARSFPLPTAAPERDTEWAAWVNPDLPLPPHSKDEFTSI